MNEKRGEIKKALCGINYGGGALMFKSKKSTKIFFSKDEFLKIMKGNWQLYLLLLPGLLYLIIFNYGPMLGLQIAFKDYSASKGIFGSVWADPWYKHFKRFLTYPDTWKMIKNTLSLTLLALAMFPFPVIFALLLNELRNIRFKKSVQMLTYMPHFLSEVVVCSIIILFLDTEAGPLTNLIVALGGERQNLLSNPAAFKWVYVLSGLWQSIGWDSILYISALSSVSMELVEAAKIDGANRFQIMWHIYIPGILPTIIICFLMQVGRLMTVGYSKIFLLQNSLNMESSNVLSLYVYNIGLMGGQYSYSTAIGLFNNLVNIFVLVVVNKFTKRVTDTSLF